MYDSKDLSSIFSNNKNDILIDVIYVFYEDTNNEKGLIKQTLLCIVNAKNEKSKEAY